jgi:hypothetical protein
LPVLPEEGHDLAIPPPNHPPELESSMTVETFDLSIIGLIVLTLILIGFAFYWRKTQ